MKIPQFIAFGGFTAHQLRRDAVAAAVVTAIAIPESLAFAAIVGLPLHAGLYCALLAPVVFALLTSSKHLVVGADSATAALVASGAATVALAGTSNYVGAVGLLGLLVGAVLLLMSAVRFGFLADLISKPVFVGFLAGIGIQLLCSKLPELLGLDVDGSALEKFWYTLTHLDLASLPTVYFSLGLFGVVWLLNRKKLPGALFGIVGAIGLTYFFGADTLGLRVVERISPGLPTFALPAFELAQAKLLLPSAFAIAVVVLAQSSAVIRSTASRFDEPVDDNRDLAALGLGNVASAVTGGFAINGSPPRTIAAEMNGGRTQMVNVFMALFVALILLLLTPMFAYLPVASLAVVICFIGWHLLDFKQLQRIAKSRKAEFGVAMIAFVGVVVFGVLYGVVIAVVTSIIDRLRRQYRPTDEVLLRDGRLAPWANERLDQHHKHRSSPPGVVAYRFNGSLFFENASYFSRRLTSVVKGAKQPTHTVVLDAGGINDIDYTAADTLRHLANKFSADDIRLCLAHVSPGLLDVLTRYNLIDIIGRHNVYPSLESAIFSSSTSRRSSIEMVERLKLPSSEYIVIGGGVLEALGIRDTNDIDIVVSKNLYHQFKRKGWREYIQDDGKHVLSHNGYQVMETYVGKSLRDLRPNLFTVQKVHFMGLEDLVACKRKMGRKKDYEDIRLVEEYLRHIAKS